MSFQITHTYDPSTQKAVAKDAVVLDPEHPSIRYFIDRWFSISPGEAAGIETTVGAARYLAQLIEAQTKPPRIPEPRGLGAVVEDSAHRLWLRHSNSPGSFPWICEGQGSRGWSEFDGVKVLSEGVTP